ncbi:hypothetical protein T484DRAFT_1756090 [Baffinella frigidus]|nr:hypothetical protein T484DRAFT_1756090 [Cryptophyta sp. CCMP2293]
MDITTAEVDEARLNFQDGVYAVHRNVTGEQKRLVAEKMRLASEDVQGAAADLLNYSIALCEEHNYAEAASKLRFVVDLQTRNTMARPAPIVLVLLPADPAQLGVLVDRLGRRVAFATHPS